MTFEQWWASEPREENVHTARAAWNAAIEAAAATLESLSGDMIEDDMGPHEIRALKVGN